MVELNKENFEEEVLKAEGKVFVDFYGDGCVPCAALMPFVHQYAETYGDKMKFCALNTTKARRLAIWLRKSWVCLLWRFMRTVLRSMCWSKKTAQPRASKR